MKQTINILFTSESYLPRIGGAEIHLVKLREQLHRLGFKSLLVTIEPIGASKDDPGVIRVANNWKQIFLEIKHQITNSDLIHSHYASKMAVIAGILAKWYKKPFIITEHGFGILDHPNHPLYSRILHKLYCIVAVNLADAVIATSNELKDMMKRHTIAKKVITISNGVDDYPVQKTKIKRFYIATFRRLVDKNGVHYLVQAAPLIKQKIPQLHIDIFGDGYNREKIEKLIKNLKAEKYIRLKGELVNNRVIKTMSHYDAIVFPSTAEARSLACLEAMMAGRPVIASKIGGLIELVGKKQERGYLINFVPNKASSYYASWNLPEQNIQVLADGIGQTLKDNQKEIKAKLAQAYVKNNYTWENIIQKTMKVYEKYV